MEMSLFICVSSTVSNIEKLCYFLGDDAPFYEEDVEEAWRAMFLKLEAVDPPEEITLLSSDSCLMYWTTGLDNELYRSYGLALTEAGFEKQILYIEEDDESYYLRNNKGKFDLISQTEIEMTKVSRVKTTGWDGDSAKIIKTMASLLKYEMP